MTRRLRDWRPRFEAVVDEIKWTQFDWKTQHDCVMGLVVRLVEAVTGVDHGAAYRGRYASETGALRVMRKAGFSDIADLVASILDEIHPSQAAIGDLVAFKVDTPFGHALGVVNGERAFVLRPEGIATMDILEADRAFKV